MLQIAQILEYTFSHRIEKSSFCKACNKTSSGHRAKQPDLLNIGVYHWIFLITGANNSCKSSQEFRCTVV